MPVEGRNSAAYLIAFDNTNSTTTGVAINAMPTVTILDPVMVPLVVRDDSGNTLTASTIQLNPNGHASFSLAQQFPLTAGIRAERSKSTHLCFGKLVFWGYAAPLRSRSRACRRLPDSLGHVGR